MGPGPNGRNGTLYDGVPDIIITSKSHQRILSKLFEVRGQEESVLPILLAGLIISLGNDILCLKLKKFIKFVAKEIKPQFTSSIQQFS